MNSFGTDAYEELVGELGRMRDEMWENFESAAKGKPESERRGMLSHLAARLQEIETGERVLYRIAERLGLNMAVLP